MPENQLSSMLFERQNFPGYSSSLLFSPLLLRSPEMTFWSFAFGLTLAKLTDKT